VSVAIVGGLDRLRRSYEKKCRDMGFQGKVFSKRIPKLANRMTGVSGILFLLARLPILWLKRQQKLRECVEFLLNAVTPAVFQL